MPRSRSVSKGSSTSASVLCQMKSFCVYRDPLNKLFSELLKNQLAQDNVSAWWSRDVPLGSSTERPKYLGIKSQDGHYPQFNHFRGRFLLYEPRTGCHGLQVQVNSRHCSLYDNGEWLEFPALILRKPSSVAPIPTT
ncbi:Small RNA degrading nuclease 2 [Fusarium oxysporum f. sp. albedinis]|nr:Small RNA degrading nuclease 2 [Fusarium oxysporum f. sp. albedinis]